MKEKILEMLKDSNEYVSGQEICKKLGVSRTAVWKNIRLLKNAGYVIDAVNNKGYKLLAEPDVVSAADIKQYLNTEFMGREIIYYDETDSTNIRAKLEGESGAVHGSLYVANKQTAGRGRRGRSWSAEKGAGIYMTFLIRPDGTVQNISAITIISAIAVSAAVEETAHIKAEIKWPNDVLVNGRKICGILTEMASEGTDIKYVVVGIGINVFTTEFPEEISDKATSIKLQNGCGCDRNVLTASVANNFERLYTEFCRTCSLDFVIEEYNRLLVNKDRRVYVIDNDEKREYTALGLASNGGLRVMTSDGKEEIIISGEVSVRGICGYV